MTQLTKDLAQALPPDQLEPLLLHSQIGLLKNLPLIAAELHIEEILDEASKDSFPASNSPARILKPFSLRWL